MNQIWNCKKYNWRRRIIKRKEKYLTGVSFWILALPVKCYLYFYAWSSLFISLWFPMTTEADKTKLSQPLRFYRNMPLFVCSEPSPFCTMQPDVEYTQRTITQSRIHATSRCRSLLGSAHCMNRIYRERKMHSPRREQGRKYKDIS